MKKRNGFTLVELLAVIVVLAIIMIIAIPSVLEAMNNAKKNSFYLYAQKIYNEAMKKYSSSTDELFDDSNCIVYDIKKDLNLPSTGNFDGWARVERVPVSSGNNSVSITINSDKVIQNVKQCVDSPDKDSKSCTPNIPYRVSSDTKKLLLSNAISKGQVFCVSYQLLDDKGGLGKEEIKCVTYEEGTPYLDSFDYKVKITMTDKSYSIENAEMTSDMSQEKFLKILADYKKKHSSLAINKPSCDGDDVEIRGTTTLRVTESTKSTQSKSTSSDVPTKNTDKITDKPTDPSTKNTSGSSDKTESTKSTSSTDKSSNVSNSTKSTNSNNTDRPTNSSNSTNPTSENSSSNVTDESKTVLSNEKSTSYINKTTIASPSDNLLLKELIIEGYKIDFNPTTYYYDIIVPNKVTSVKVIATPKDSNSKVTISGQNGFVVGHNQILIEVSDIKTGKRLYYRVIVTRLKDNNPETSTTSNKTTINSTTSSTTSNEAGPKPDSSIDDSNAYLQTLEVSGYTLDFNPNVYEYSLKTNGESDIAVDATPAVKGANVLITGTTNLEDGGEVVVKVTSKNGAYEKIYTIKIEVEGKSEKKNTLKMVAIGLAVLTIAVVVILALTRKNRSNGNYTGTTVSTSGPGINNGEFNTPESGIATPIPITPQAPTVVQPPQEEQNINHNFPR